MRSFAKDKDVFLVVLAVGLTAFTFLALTHIIGRGREIEQRQRQFLTALAAAFGLPESNEGIGGDLEYLARGTWNGIELALGIRPMEKLIVDGRGSLRVVEIAALGLRDLGVATLFPVDFGVRSVASRPRVRVTTGDISFDTHFMMFCPQDESVEEGSMAFRAAPPIVDFPWLDEKTRAWILRLKAFHMLKVVHGEISIVLGTSATDADIDLALDLVLHLAGWSGRSAPVRPYR